MANLLPAAVVALSLMPIPRPLSEPGFAGDGLQAGAEPRTGTAPQAPELPAPASLTRVKDAIDKAPARSLKFDVKMAMPVATFRTTTQRDYVLPFVEQLRKEFELTPLQRQSAQWASKCCGMNLLALTKGLQGAGRRRAERRTREQIARELADLRAAAKKQSHEQ